jgi:endonuclease V-like protein UPF0215 family
LSVKRFRIIKPEIRVVGIDDGKHVFRSKTQVPIVGVVYKGGSWFEGFMSSTVWVDGFDVTEKVAEMILASPHYKQLRVILLNGLTFAGFNVMDIVELNKKTKLPIITLTKDEPNIESIRSALSNLNHAEERYNTILKAGPIIPIHNNGKKIFMQFIGLYCEDAQKIVAITSTRSSIPEPLRVAHLIASGTSFCNKKGSKSLKAIKIWDSKSVEGT